MTISCKHEIYPGCNIKRKYWCWLSYCRSKCTAQNLSDWIAHKKNAPSWTLRFLQWYYKYNNLLILNKSLIMKQHACQSALLWPVHHQLFTNTQSERPVNGAMDDVKGKFFSSLLSQMSWVITVASKGTPAETAERI